MAASLLLSWREGVTTEFLADHEFIVRGPDSRIVLRKLALEVVEGLLKLAGPGEDEQKIADEILATGGANALTAWYYLLQNLTRRMLLCRTLRAGGVSLAVLLPTSLRFHFELSAFSDESRFLLSRFASIRREGSDFVLESPLAHARVVLTDRRSTAWLGALAKPSTASELAHATDGLPAEAAFVFLSLLKGAGMLDESGTDSEGEPLKLRTWEFHDLLFHARSRKGRSDAPFGATYRFVGQIDPPPALKPPEIGETLELYRPDLDRLDREDPPLSRILERRRSIREYGEPPLSASQLGEFLFRVARVKDEREAEVETPHGPLSMSFTSRPYPSGGGLYELEFYLAVHACIGLASGLYRYQSERHQLVQIRALTKDVEQLLEDAAASAGIPRQNLQVVIILAARFQRLAWKYASIAYSLILKHVGVVYQTMYLTATAMNLAPCALGGGDSDVFSRAAGTDYYVETSVGEFLLGSARK